jgi:hypothetical protein
LTKSLAFAMALLTALVVAAQLLRPPAVELMQRDSQGYLDFSPTRTAGYPLFLRAVEHLPGGLAALPRLQLGLYGLSAFILALSFGHLVASNAAGLLLLIMLLGNPQVNRLSFMIMTESLFLTSLMVLLALFCRLVRTSHWPSLALASLITGLAVLIRPAGYPLLAALPILAWWGWRSGLSLPPTVLAASLPFLAVLGAGMALYHTQHGLWRTESFLGSNLYGKAAAIVEAVPPDKQDDETRWMAATVAPDIAMIDRAPSWFDRFRMLSAYYDVWRWDTLYEPLPARTGIPAGDTAALDAAMLDRSLHVIAAAPMAYLQDVALNYSALWWVPDAMTHAQLARFDEFLAGLGPLPHLGRYPPWHREHNDLAIWALHGFMMIALGATLWWGWRAAVSLVGRVPLPPLARLGAVTTLIVQGSFLLVAALQTGMPRYMWAMWPALSILFVLALAAGFRRVRPAVSSGPCPPSNHLRSDRPRLEALRTALASPLPPHAIFAKSRCTSVNLAPVRYIPVVRRSAGSRAGN